MELKAFEFQERSSRKLAERIQKFLSEEESQHILLEMPMASGKTTTCALALDTLFSEEDSLATIFISKGDLPNQANRTFKNILPNSTNVYDLNDTKNIRHFNHQDVLTVGWEILNNSAINSFGQVELTSKYIKGTESYLGLREIIKNTVERGLRIVLIIDEVHEFAFTPASQEIIKALSPNVIIGVTATPKDKNRETANYTIKVEYDEVKATGLIKQGVYINQTLKSFSHLEDEDAVLEASYARYLERKAAYERLDLDINPLILIQLPSDNQITQDSDRLTLKKVKEFFETKNITEDNGRFAIWLADHRSSCVDNGELQRNNGKPVVLVFKTAVATGIDIPRASILAIFRKSGSITLSTQVAGRILRQPTLQIMGDELLDYSDIITNLSTEMIQFEGPDVGQVFKTFKAEIKPGLGDIKFNLPSVRMSTIQKPLLNLKSEGLIIDKALPRILAIKSDLGFDVVAKQGALGANKVSSEIQGLLEGLANSSEGISLRQSEYTTIKAFRHWVNQVFNSLSVDTAQVYKLVSRGISVLEDLLAEIGVNKSDVPKFIVGSVNNANKLSVIIKDAINQLIANGELKITRNTTEVIYAGFPAVQNYLVEGVAKTSGYQKNAYQDSPLVFDSSAEKAFDSFIDGQIFVKAWSYNPPREVNSFAIKYKTKDPQTGIISESAMYPDRLILLQGNTLLIAEVKSGRTAVDAKEKSDALQGWIKNINLLIQSGKIDTDISRVIGGIIDVEVSNDTYIYRVFIGNSYSPDRNDAGWKELTYIIPNSTIEAGKQAKRVELERQLAELVEK